MWRGMGGTQGGAGPSDAADRRGRGGVGGRSPRRQNASRFCAGGWPRGSILGASALRPVRDICQAANTDTAVKRTAGAKARSSDALIP